MRRILSLLLCGLAVAGYVSCGAIQKQNRPVVVQFLPGNDQVLPAFLGCIRVTYDEPIRVLNDTSAIIRADSLGNDGVVLALIYADPADPYSVFVRPARGGHFFPGLQHHLTMQEGSVANAEDHYALDTFDTYFTVGPAPSIFVTSDDGSVYELAPDTGVQLSSTSPPVGYRTRDIIGSSNRVWAWLDPIGVGSSLLATFHPGDAGMTIVPLAGETGTRKGTGFALSTNASILYAAAEDVGPGRVLVHRIAVAAVTEIPSALVLATPLPAGAHAYRPASDPQHERLYVAQDDGAGGGWLSSVDTTAWAQLDLVPGPGIDPVALPDGAGPVTYDTGGDNGRIFVLLPHQPYAGFSLVNPFGFGIDTAFETLYTGVPSAGIATPDGLYFVQGLAGYGGIKGLVRSDTLSIGEGFLLDLVDDVGGVPQGSNTVGALLVDTATGNLLAFADAGTKTILCVYTLDNADNADFVEQIDLDPVAPGIQGLDLSASVPGVVTGATTLFGLAP